MGGRTAPREQGAEANVLSPDFVIIKVDAPTGYDVPLLVVEVKRDEVLPSVALLQLLTYMEKTLTGSTATKIHGLLIQGPKWTLLEQTEPIPPTGPPAHVILTGDELDVTFAMRLREIAMGHWEKSAL